MIVFWYLYTFHGQELIDLLCIDTVRSSTKCIDSSMWLRVSTLLIVLHTLKPQLVSCFWFRRNVNLARFVLPSLVGMGWFRLPTFQQCWGVFTTRLQPISKAMCSGGSSWCISACSRLGVTYYNWTMASQSQSSLVTLLFEQDTIGTSHPLRRRLISKNEIEPDNAVSAVGPSNSV